MAEEPWTGRVKDVEEALEEAEEVAFELYRAKHRASGLCWVQLSAAGPHPGCGEFAPDEDYLCGGVAQKWVLEYEYDEYGPPRPVWIRLCTEHEAIYRADAARLTGTPDGDHYEWQGIAFSG